MHKQLPPNENTIFRGGTIAKTRNKNIHIIKEKSKRLHKKARRAFLNAARRFFIRIRRNRADPLCKREADLPAAAAWAEARAGSNDRLCTFLYAFRAVWARL